MKYLIKNPQYFSKYNDEAEVTLLVGYLWEQHYGAVWGGFYFGDAQLFQAQYDSVFTEMKAAGYEWIKFNFCWQEAMRKQDWDLMEKYAVELLNYKDFPLAAEINYNFAWHLMQYRKHLPASLALIKQLSERSIALKRGSYALTLHASILYYLGETAAAIKISEEALSLASDKEAKAFVQSFHDVMKAKQKIYYTGMRIEGTAVYKHAMSDMQSNHLGNANNWSASLFLKGGGVVNFRADSGENWGASDFPKGKATQNGIAIPISQSGLYEVSFNNITGEYAFKSAGSLGLIGDATATGWESDTDLTTADHQTYTGIFYLKSDGTQKVKFRLNDAWDKNWGGNGLSGLAIAGGSDIVIPETGHYLVTFNLMTQEYSIVKQADK